MGRLRKQTRQDAKEADAAASSSEPLPKHGSGKSLAVIAGIAAIVVAAAAVYFAMFAPYVIDERNFTDSAVCEVLASQADADGDGKLSREEAGAVETLDLSGKGITSVEGLECLTGLKSLNVSGATITSLDASHFKMLETLDASDCESLAELNLGDITTLKSLDITDTQIKDLNVSAQAGLQELRAAGAPLSSLDVSSNPQLAVLELEEEVAVAGIDETLLRAQYQPLEYRRLGTDGLGTQQYYNSMKSFEYDDQGRVTKIVTSNSDADTNELMGDPTIEEFEYDDQGRCVKHSYGSDEVHEATLSYDEQGRLVGLESDSGTMEMQYDVGGRLVKVIDGSDKSSERTSETPYTSYQYDEQGRLAKTETPVSDSRSTGSIYRYDEKGNLKSIDFRDKTNTITTTEEFEYDDQGRCVKLRTRGPYGAMNDSFYEYRFSYDKNGNLVTTDSLTLTYDGDGNLIGREFLGGEVGEGATEITYRRVFTPKDAEELEQPIEIGNPFSVSRVIYPYTINLSSSADPVAASFGPYPLGV